jgi:hypothetical protein
MPFIFQACYFSLTLISLKLVTFHSLISHVAWLATNLIKTDLHRALLLAAGGHDCILGGWRLHNDAKAGT